jgi:hypothetical protein
MTKMEVLYGEEINTGIYKVVRCIQFMLTNSESVDITFVDPNGKLCLSEKIKNIIELPALFDRPSVKEMLTIHGQVSLLEPNLENRTVRVGYMKKGDLARIAGATLQ